MNIVGTSDQALTSVPVQLGELAVLAVVVVVKLAQIYSERRRDVTLAPRWPTVVAALGVALAVSLRLPRSTASVASGASAVAANHLLQLGENLGLMAAFFSLLLLLVPRRRAVYEAWVFGGAVTVVAALMGYCAVNHIPTDSAAAHQHQPGVAAFFAIAGGYLVYSSGAVAVLSWTYSRNRSLRDPAVKVALILTALGSAAETVGATIRLVTLGSAAASGSYPQSLFRSASLFFDVCHPVLVVALVLPLAAGRYRSTMLWLGRLRRYISLRTLWVVSTSLYPEFVRHTPGPAPTGAPQTAPGSASTSARREGLSARYVRRVTECRQGHNQGLIDGKSSIQLDGQHGVLCQRFYDELTASGAKPIGDVDNDLDEDARYLAAISRLMRRRGIQWLDDARRDPATGADSAVAPEQSEAR